MPKAVATLDQELADLERQREQLEAERDRRTAEIAANLDGDTTEQESALGRILARLRAIPVRRADVEAARDKAAQRAALKELEKRFAALYKRHEHEYQMKQKLAEKRAELKALEDEYRAHFSETDDLRQSAVAMQLNFDGYQGSNAIREMVKDVVKPYEFTDPTMHGYESYMRARAARGHLPPGTTLEDFGITD